MSEISDSSGTSVASSVKIDSMRPIKLESKGGSCNDHPNLSRGLEHSKFGADFIK